jgi:hypothetical protein
VLLAASALMFLTGLGFTGVTEFWPLLVVAVVGTLNPSGGDVSVFLPTEQALLPGLVPDRGRTALFARYNLAGTFAAALGALASGAPVAVAKAQDWDILDAERAGFIAYMAVALLVASLYSRLSEQRDASPARPGGALATSRGFVLRLSAVFAVDSFGGGFVVQSLVALWLYQRFDMPVELAGTRAAFGHVPARGLMGRLTHRPDTDHGLHPPAGQCVHRDRSAHAQRASCRHVHPATDLAGANGRAGASELRHGDGAARGARCGRQRDERTA